MNASDSGPNDARPRRSIPVGDLVLFAFCISLAGAASILLRQDANWDLQNYHYYNPWAWLHGRIFTRDIGAAQLQTYHNALFDLPFYAMVAAQWPPRIIAIALAIPAAVAAFFFAKLLTLLFGNLPRDSRRMAVVLAWAIGMTSAMGIGTLATTMNEWPLAASVLAALWLIVRHLVRHPAGPVSRRILLGAGTLCGVAAGGKLTAATFAVGLCVALLFRGPCHRAALRVAFADAFLFGIAVLAGAAIALGPWAWALWTHFESPIFPYLNDWIRSPWFGQHPVIERFYGPHTVLEWLAFPLTLLSPKAFYVAEVAYRDPRMPFLYALAVLACVACVTRRRFAPVRGAASNETRRAWQLVTVFFVVSFLLWTAQHSVYRYIVVLDVLSGALILKLLHLLPRPPLTAGAAIVIAIALIATTRWADWWRVDFGPHWFAVQMPPVAANAMVLLTSDAPMSFVLPHFPPDTRHIGVSTSIMDPLRTNALERSVADAIRSHHGPLYQLTAPAGKGSTDLLPHRVWRDQASCHAIRTNMTADPLELCRLYRLRDYEQP